VINKDREQRKLHTRTVILEAAIKIFAEIGFDAASLGAIGRHCNIKKSLVQYHFETKEKLWKAAINRLWSQLRSAFPDVASCAKASSKQEYIRSVLRQIIRFAKGNPSWIGIMFREASTPGPRLDWLIETHVKQDFDNGTRFVIQAQQQGLLPDVPPVHLLHIIFGSLTYALSVAPLTQQATGIDMTSEQSLETMVDALMQMLCVHSSNVSALDQ
jgi:TetR/AcrR family transcriptional regulator